MVISSRTGYYYAYGDMMHILWFFYILINAEDLPL